MKWNRKYTFVLAGIITVAMAGGKIGYQVTAADTGENEEKQPMAEENEETGMGFSEEGTTQIQTESQTLLFAAEAVTMTVEEVYVESGTAVGEGDALLKLTDESMEAAIAYYEDAVAEAKETLETAELEFSSGVLEAEYALSNARLSAENAEDKYEASLSSLTVKVEEKKQDYDDAVREIWEYQDAIDNGTYYVQVGIDEKNAQIAAAETALAEAQNNLSMAQSNYDAALEAYAADMENLKSQIACNAAYEILQTAAEQLEADYAAVQEAASELTRKQSAADEAKSTLEKANMTFESAVKEYNSKVDNANQRIAELTESLDKLYEEYEEAERERVTSEAGIQKEYEEAVLEGKYADTEYEAALMELQKVVNTAREALDTLEEEQQAILEIEDGILCADRAGTIAAMRYEAGDVLYEETVLVSYYDTDTIYISVEVSQENIASLAVGDEVEVTVTGTRGGGFTGEIYSIAAEKTSGGSMSNVTYAVVITVDNAKGMIGSGSTATVTFDLEQ